jgi:poly(hydroxyalkanoate) depolymerase family esterase
MTFSNESTLNVDGITDTIQRAFAAAGLKAQSEPMEGVPAGVTQIIRQTLSGSGRTARPTAAGRGRIHLMEQPVPHSFRQFPTPPFKPIKPTPSPLGRTGPVYPGQFISRSFTATAGTLNYKLYIPLSYASRPDEKFPLIVMLHGCTQSPDDFAAGTRMNELAERHGFLVLYPAQSQTANGSKCWNWFRPGDQARDQGEPSLIAGSTREVARQYRIDESRIFVAGLSAGAAMAVVMGATHPELYAAVGAHSGLAYAAAHDAPSAFQAMRGGPASRLPNMHEAPVCQPSIACPVPTIVFHGDHDQTVKVQNGMKIVDQLTMSGMGKAHLRASVEQGAAANGSTFTRTVYADGNQPVIEHWLLHGAGHAWSGGSTSGSFTDPRGPDASSEMIRFFHSQQRPTVN